MTIGLFFFCLFVPSVKKFYFYKMSAFLIRGDKRPFYVHVKTTAIIHLTSIYSFKSTVCIVFMFYFYNNYCTHDVPNIVHNDPVDHISWSQKKITTVFPKQGTWPRILYIGTFAADLKILFINILYTNTYTYTRYGFQRLN